MDLRLLEIFCHVYEERSFSRAALRLGLTQPTISGHIKALEESFATPLFDRLGRSIRPTPAGDVLYRHGCRVIENKERTIEAMRRFLGRLDGDLCLGASTIPGEYLMPGLVSSFREIHPGIRTRLLIRDSQAVIDGILADEFELGVLGAKLEHPAIELTPFAHDRLVLAAPSTPAWSLPDQRLAAEDLRHKPMLIREAGSGTRMTVEKALTHLGVEIDDSNIVAELGSTTALKEAVKAGLGAAFLSRRAVRDEVEAGRVRILEVEGLAPFLERSFYTGVHRQRPSSPLRDAFLEHLRHSRAQLSS